MCLLKYFQLRFQRFEMSAHYAWDFVAIFSSSLACCHILPVGNKEHIHSLMLLCWILIGNRNINVPFFIFSGYLLSTGKLYYALALLGLTIPQVFFQVYLTVLVAPFFFVWGFFCSRCFHVWSKVPFSLRGTRFQLFDLWGIGCKTAYLLVTSRKQYWIYLCAERNIATKDILIRNA